MFYFFSEEISNVDKITFVHINCEPKMNHSIGFDDDAPPAKRLKLQMDNICKIDENNNIEKIDPKPDTRKRKIAVRRPEQKNILHLNVDVILDIFDRLPLNGKSLLFSMFKRGKQLKNH